MKSKKELSKRPGGQFTLGQVLKSRRNPIINRKERRENRYAIERLKAIIKTALPVDGIFLAVLPSGETINDHQLIASKRKLRKQLSEILREDPLPKPNTKNESIKEKQAISIPEFLEKDIVVHMEPKEQFRVALNIREFRKAEPRVIIEEEVFIDA